MKKSILNGARVMAKRKRRAQGWSTGYEIKRDIRHHLGYKIGLMAWYLKIPPEVVARFYGTTTARVQAATRKLSIGHDILDRKNQFD